MAVARIPVAAFAEADVRSLVTVRGKELSRSSTVGDARALLRRHGVLLVPLLDEGGRYLGAVTEDALPATARDDEPVLPFAGEAPSVGASSPLREAVAVLEETGRSRLVVLDDEGVGYVGLLCLRSDRATLCVDAECLADG